MNFHEFGDPRSPAVMLVHGAGNAWWGFLRQARALEGRFRVILPTLDGHAEECGEEYVSTEDEACGLLEYVDSRCGGGLFLLGGVSLGGQIVMEMLGRRPDVARRAIVDGALCIPQPAMARACSACAALLWPLMFGKAACRLQMCLSIQSSQIAGIRTKSCAGRLSRAKAIDRAALYDVNEAVALVKKAAVAKFDETIEVHIRTGCDGRHADQQIRGAVVLPHGTGKQVRVLVFAKNAKADEAKAAGAEFVGAEELIPKIQNEGWLDFDVVVATPDMMGVVGRLGRILGPKGLMPNPKAGTVTMDVTKAVNDIKAGKIEYRLDKTNIIHVPIGKASFTEEQLTDNFQTLIEAINKAKPAAVKGQYLKSVTIAPTMGPGVKLNPVKLA